MAQIDQYTVEASLALAGGDVTQGMQQFFHVGRIVGLFTGITSGVDPRRAAKRIDGQAGVVGDRR